MRYTTITLRFRPYLLSSFSIALTPIPSPALRVTSPLARWEPQPAGKHQRKSHKRCYTNHHHEQRWETEEKQGSISWIDDEQQEGMVEKKKVRQAGWLAGWKNKGYGTIHQRQIRLAGCSTSEISAYSAPLTHKLHSPKTTSKAPPHGVFNLVSPSNVG